MFRMKPTGSIDPIQRLACLAALAFVTPSWAHHSFAMFDRTKTVALQGTVKEFQWTNPHCFIQLLVPSPDGASVEWSIEMNSPGASFREGWRPGTLTAGQMVSLMINPVRDGTPGGRLVSATDPTGRTLNHAKPKP